ncbi:diacylglycerol kinase family lipid kinase [Ectothiorhodospiraceae bacterium WFHF3C12]|nr:diacylglycerol kinase family lipid kinase [Ectothiorhodospiraceae bacterium WFHF3C12]
MDDVLFVINPLAASGRADRVWMQLAARHPALRRAAVIRTADPIAATRLLIERLKPSIRRVVAIGGDGTLHHTANVLLSLPAPEKRSLGLVPAGTGSDLARGLRLARQPQLALDRALDGETVDLDVLSLTHGDTRRYAVNVASAGLSVPVVAAVSQRRRRGPVAYFRAALEAVRRETPPNARVIVDGEPWYEGPLLLLALANGCRFGRGMRIAPDARADDGRLQVVLVEPAPLARLLPWLPTLYAGWHYAAPFVRHRAARTVRVEPVDGTRSLTEADGDLSLPLPVNVSVVPGALRLRGLTPSATARRRR